MGDGLPSHCIQPDAWPGLRSWGSAQMDKNSLPLADEAPKAVLLHTDHRGLSPHTSLEVGDLIAGDQDGDMSPGAATFPYMASLRHVPSLLSSARAILHCQGQASPWQQLSSQGRQGSAPLSWPRTGWHSWWLPFPWEHPAGPSKIRSGSKPEPHPAASGLLPYVVRRLGKPHSSEQ